MGSLKVMKKINNWSGRKSYLHQENHLPKILNYVLTCAIILKLVFTDKNTMYMKFVVIVKSKLN